MGWRAGLGGVDVHALSGICGELERFGPRSIEVGERPDPEVAVPTDAVVRVVLACVCGSNLWYWAVRVPFAGATLVKVPGSGHSGETVRSLLTLSDVMCTGHHAAVSAGVAPGSVVAVVGDGAVGLSAILASARLGAARIIALSRAPARQEIARAFGATDIIGERGEEAIARVMDLTDGIGVDAALECVGTGQSMATNFGIARPGSIVGAVGAPHGVEVPIETVIFRNVGFRGGVSPARRYIPELMPDVLEGRINPGAVLDYESDLDGIPDAYAAMDERRAIKALVRVGSL